MTDPSPVSEPVPGPEGEASGAGEEPLTSASSRAGADDDADARADEAVNTEAANDDGPRDEPRDPFGEGEADRIAADHAASADVRAGTLDDSGARGAHPDTALAAERLSDLQRLQAEYVNYKRRVDRDRAMVQELAVQSVLDGLLPVLDDIYAAREHGDLVDGPFAAIADKLEATLAKFGLERFGEAGAVFDPTIHEALMHTAWDPANPALPAGATSTTVVLVLQPGYRSGDRVIRPARVSVADPE